MTLSADEFIRRFLLYVLPDGFQGIRYYEPTRCWWVFDQHSSAQEAFRRR